MRNLVRCNFSLLGHFVVSHYDAFFVVLIVGAPYYRRYFFSALLFVFASFGYRECVWW